MSRRLRIVVIAILTGVVVLFLLFLKHYAPKPATSNSASDVITTNSESASRMIERIQRENPQPIVVKGKPNSLHITHEINLKADTSNEAQTGLTAKTFEQGGESDILVYHRAWPQAAENASYHALPPQLRGSNFDINNSVNPNTSMSQNQQQQKQEFLKNENVAQSDYIASKLHKPISPYEIKAGTIIPATLVTGINSDLPGQILARVRRDVFDTVTGNHLLIPQGTTLIGRYNFQIAYGQNRVLIVWTRLIFPNGNSFDLRDQPGIDLTGMAGLKDKVDNHYFRVFSSALMLSVFGAASQLSQPQNNSQQYTTQQILYGAIGQQLSQTAAQMIERNLNIQPSITIRPGAELNIFLMKDIALRRVYRF